MRYLNEAKIIGRIGKEPKITRRDGWVSAKFSVATSYKKKGGEVKTEWHNVIFWGEPAGLIETFGGKGRLIYVSGRLETNKWKHREHPDLTMSSTSIVGDDFIFLDGLKTDKPEKGAGRAGVREGPSRSVKAPPAEVDPDEDIPF